jgi:hypothetical protein
MYFILSYFPTRSAVLCIGDTVQYSENEMRYGAYRDKRGFALYYFRRLRLREKNFTRSQATTNVHYHESGSSALWWWNRITIHLRPSYVRQLSDLPFFGCPRDFILLILLRHTRHRISHLGSVLLALCSTLYPHIHPDPIRFHALLASAYVDGTAKTSGTQHSNRGPLPHKTDSNSLRRQGQLKSLIFPVEWLEFRLWQYLGKSTC